MVAAARLRTSQAKMENFNPYAKKFAEDLENLASRGYTDGFFQRHHEQDYQNYLDNHSKSLQQRFVGELLSYNDSTGLAEVDVKNRFAVGDELELITPSGNRSFRLREMLDMQGKATEVAPGSGHRVQIPLPSTDCTMALLAVNL